MYPMKQQQQYFSPKNTSRKQSPYQSPVKKVLATVSRNNVDCQNLEDCLPLLLQVQRQRQEDSLPRQQQSPGEAPGGPLNRTQPQIRPQQADAQIAVINRSQRGSFHQRGGNTGGPNQQLLRGGPQRGNAAVEGETSGTSCDEDCEEDEPRKPKKPLYRRFYSYVREAWTGVKSALDSELEDLETPPRYRPDSLESLCRATRFSPAEIKKIYRGFKAECPTGVVKEETFKMIYAQFFPQGANSGQYAHYVFNTLDQDHSGLISFEDFVQNLSILSRGSLEEKLRWAFSLYDINGDGCITREEMTDIVSSVYELMGKLAEPCIDEDTVKEKVDRIFQKMDKNQDGVVTLDEFLDCCKSDKDISASMAVFDPYM